VIKKEKEQEKPSNALIDLLDVEEPTKNVKSAGLPFDFLEANAVPTPETAPAPQCNIGYKKYRGKSRETCK